MVTFMAAQQSLLQEPEPTRAARALERTLPEFVRRLERVVGPAVHGRPEAVRSYVRSWRLLQDRLLGLVHETTPGLVADSGNRMVFVNQKGQPSEILTEIVEQGALHAPFSPWVAEFGPGRGVALFLLSEIRRSLPDGVALVSAHPLTFPYSDVSEREFKRFARLVWHELTTDDPLEGIASAFGLSLTELGRMFMVTRQAVVQWMQEGIPAARSQRVHTAQRIADVLRRNLKSDRIPAVVREPAKAYGDRSIIAAIRAGDGAKVLEAVEQVFDWATTA